MTDHSHDHTHEHPHEHDGKTHVHPHTHEHAHEPMHHESHDHGHAHVHPHTHEHDHGHAHPHDHSHEGPLVSQVPRNTPLARGAALGKVLYFDAASGVAGDMTIAALLDLGVPREVVLDAVAKVKIDGYHLHFGAEARNAIVGTKVDVHVDAPQPERTFREIRQIIETSDLSPSIKARTLATYTRLAEAEASVHNRPVDDVHFHEVGAVDAIVDMVGSAACLDYLGGEILVSSLPLGSGRVQTRHGPLSLPAPATLHCLHGFVTHEGGRPFEFVTPTGAAIVGAHGRSSAWPTMVVERAGYGVGTASLPDRPNLLRVVLGSLPEKKGGPYLLETNVDDATGEEIGFALDRFFELGALDAWATPIAMKKSRPASMVSVLVSKELRLVLERAMVELLPTLGIRVREIERSESTRSIVTVDTEWGPIPVKVGRFEHGVSVKAEYDTCAAIARRENVSVRCVQRRAEEIARTA
ncbi:MAG: nickel pincer cofactor biosynthesis protein LarC [Polyangiaceae bacterium]|nr:nickel pincer cofactor biosynthesis protein LarC [Polyangiaceae bacterium]